MNFCFNHLWSVCLANVLYSRYPLSETEGNYESPQWEQPVIRAVFEPSATVCPGHADFVESATSVEVATSLSQLALPIIMKQFLKPATDGYTHCIQACSISGVSVSWHLLAGRYYEHSEIMRGHLTMCHFNGISKLGHYTKCCVSLLPPGFQIHSS